MPEVIGTIDELRNRVGETRDSAAMVGGDTRVVLVPTMGALHEGHLALIRRARQLGDIVVVSIFVNPLQFGVNEDLDRYPRTFAADLQALAAEDVTFVFAPSAHEMYPEPSNGTRVTAGPIASLLEGASRPGHFDGMLTVVAKLLNIVTPDTAVFGQKDAQQVFLAQSMVTDLNVRVAIDVVPTVREASGLALSSRNRNLNEAQLHAAAALYAGLTSAQSAAAGGSVAALAAAHALIDPQPLVKLDYLVVVHPHTFLPVGAEHVGPARMLVAALVGGTRLIDNVSLDVA
ncbi:pantoate--beta-alanine ligase [Cryobacterium psychrophilum]|uniref:Pantothenate synthetase n=1 Tax=Cryobacterium psychrophilum TaxID=41988 RepID=A0A4Y8KJP8_9MICO|nr:pantoate--beta-alanine ligase [Cryobacterium psychrophilum]TFD76478.1 pantoate--beta-alanine ligase [Cryobacterium psychrophilum]